MTGEGLPGEKGSEARKAMPPAGRAAMDAYGRSSRLNEPEMAPRDPAQVPALPHLPDEPDFQDRELLITEFLPLVKFVAHRIANRLPAHVDVDDLIHSGILGLMDAVRKFEPDRNVKFKTYAEQRIRGAILDGLRDLDWVPRSLRRKKKDIETAYHLLEQQHVRAATDEEVAAHLGLALDDLHHSLDELKGVTLGAFVDAGENGEGENLISFVPDPDGENPHILLQAREVRSLRGPALLLRRTDHERNRHFAQHHRKSGIAIAYQVHAPAPGQAQGTAHRWLNGMSNGQDSKPGRG